MSVPALFSLAGKAVVVTGAGRGIGRGIAESLAQCGARVVLAGRSPVPLRETQHALEVAGAEAMTVVGDITRADDRARLLQAALDRFGYVDGWINNAGSAAPEDVGPLDTIGEAQWDRVVDLNLKAAFFASQMAAHAMSRGGAIVNITSRSASYPNPGTGHYGAAKAALENLTRTMAAEWGHRGIRVNAVAPGVVMTEELAKTFNTPERIQRQVDTVPLQRLGRPEDIGPLCAYLVSDAAGWTTGALIPVNGGSFVPMGYLSYLNRVKRARV
ncbi:MAG: glucose 1-dehydrogenase [Hydrogenophaga sp.]|uniref:SDR family NAD(P)-dependent oxidoreductase n=1 Tax=Hydrogenophaga sp. TaxID=1904254 RepID=UPI001D43FAD3|nr:glucose 1-dehydrogenase [Hydrogenophaga sp.]MBX3608708.1 glucose 1-dehydrogenase [Hydrogenophaga sp.]